MSRIVRRSAALVAMAGVLTAALWIFAAPDARACSCEPVSAASLDRGDAVVVGVILQMGEATAQWEGQERFVAEINVQSDRKDNLDDVVYVTSEVDDGGNCGVSWQPGTRIAAVLYEDGGVLRTDGCSTMLPAQAEGWQPATTVGGEATLLIGGSQPYRTVAYDQAGTPIAYGFGPGEVRALSVCPGGNFALELASYDDGSYTIDTRDLAGFEITSSAIVANAGLPNPPRDVRCDSADGTTGAIDGFVVNNGAVEPSSEPFDPERFDDGQFWPQLVTESTAPIQGESWMRVARELDAAVTVAATGQTAAVDQLGSGFAFGLAQDTDDAGEPAADQNASDEANNDDSSNSLVWAGVVGIGIGITIAVVRGKRK